MAEQKLKTSGKVSGSKSKKATKVLPNFDAKKITLKQAAQMYVDLTGNNSVKSAAVKLLKQYENTALIDLFMQDDKGMSIISKTIPFADQEYDDIKSPMQALRYIGNMIKDPKGGLSPKDNIFEFLPDSDVNTDKNINIFKIKEPPKSTGSALSVNSDPKLHAMMFDAIDDIGKDNPNLKAVADALLFNLQTGLRPNAVGGLQLDDKTYNPETKSIYISSEAKGAKGNFVNVPLNDLANSILQNQISNKQVKFFKGKKGVPAGNYFFVKPNGIPVDSTDMTKLLKMLPPIPNLFFNTDTQKMYSEFAHPEMNKKGAQLIRNIHTTIASRRLFIPYDRIAYLQGRSLKGVGMSDIGEVLTYDVQFPGDVDPVGRDAQNANKFAAFYAKSANAAGYDIKEIITPPETYILKTDPLFKEYEESRLKAIELSDVKKNAPTDVEMKNNQALEDLFGMGITIDDDSKISKVTKGAGKAAKAVVGAVGVKTIASLLGGAATTVPMVAEAAIDVAFTPTPTGEEAIDPKTGIPYTQPERPPSEFMSEEDISKSAKMAKGQFEPDVFQQAMIDRKAQQDKIDSVKGQSFLTGSN